MTNEPKTAAPADRPGIQTSEFKVAAITPILAVLAPVLSHALLPLLPSWIPGVLTTASSIAYMISRGLAKLGSGS